MRSGRAVVVALLGVVLGGCSLLRDAGPPATVEIVLEATGATTAAATDDAAQVIRQRLQIAGIDADVSVPSEGTIRLVVDEPDAQRATRLATTPGELVMVGIPPEHSTLVQDGQPLPAEIDSQPVLTSSDVEMATVDAEPTTGNPAVNIVLTADGALAFDAFAAVHQGERLAIVVDGIVLSAPTINETRFGGRAQISGNFTLEEAQDLAAMLAAGPLPLDLGVQ
jgi:SecD/SecF fusion protein